MSPRLGLLFLGWSLSLLAGCGDDPAATEAPVDSGVDTAIVVEDTSIVAEASVDSSVAESAPADVSDATSTKVLGTLSGDCSGLLGAIKASGSIQIEIPWSFGSTDKFERARLSPGGQRVFDAPNAGGSSKESEVMTFELLHACAGAELLKTEKEIAYGAPPDGSPATITDMSVLIASDKIGANPKRVFKPEPFTMTDAEVSAQLTKDFQSINGSTARVLPEDKWVKQVLHVWVPNAFYYDAVKRVLPTIDATLKSNTVVLITRTTGGGFLYCDPDPAPGAECPPVK